MNQGTKQGTDYRVMETLVLGLFTHAGDDGFAGLLVLDETTGMPQKMWNENFTKGKDVQFIPLPSPSFFMQVIWHDNTTIPLGFKITGNPEIDWMKLASVQNQYRIERNRIERAEGKRL